MYQMEKQQPKGMYKHMLEHIVQGQDMIVLVVDLLKMVLNVQQIGCSNGTIYVSKPSSWTWTAYGTPDSEAECPYCNKDVYYQRRRCDVF